MAYIDKETAALIKNQIKETYPLKDGWKWSISVNHHSTFRVALMEFPPEYNFPAKCNVNHHWMDQQVEDLGGEKELEVFKKVNKILHSSDNGFFDDSDMMTDYFHTAWYVSLSVGKWDKEAKIRARI